MARVLVVEHEPHVASLHAAILEAAGHSPRISSTPEDAVIRLTDENFDALITAWRLGASTAAEVVAVAKAKGVPVIVVSAYLDEAFQGSKPHADLYFEKPVKPEEMVAAVEDLLRKAYRSAAGK
jgi:DNA-binding response OmpR family regulator